VINWKVLLSNDVWHLIDSCQTLFDSALNPNPNTLTLMTAWHGQQHTLVAIGVLTPSTPLPAATSTPLFLHLPLSLHERTPPTRALPPFPSSQRGWNIIVSNETSAWTSTLKVRLQARLPQKPTHHHPPLLWLRQEVGDTRRRLSKPPQEPASTYPTHQNHQPPPWQSNLSGVCDTPCTQTSPSASCMPDSPGPSRRNRMSAPCPLLSMLSFCCPLWNHHL